MQGKQDRLFEGASRALRGLCRLVERVARAEREAPDRDFEEALAARDRGELDSAFRLLQSAVRRKPDDDERATALWDVAIATQRASEAAPALLELIRRHSLAGELELAAQYWIELTNLVPGKLLDPATLLRILPVLPQAGQPGPGQPGKGADEADYIVCALRQMVDPANSGLTPGLALRVLHVARDLDQPDVALLAAHRSLESDALHDSKRLRLEELIVELEESRDGARDPSRRHPQRTVSPLEPALSDDAAARLAARLPPSNRSSTPLPVAPRRRASDRRLPLSGQPAAETSELTVIEAAPVALEGDSLVVELQGGRKTRIEYEKIGALAVALVSGIAPEPTVVIDLVLGQRGAGQVRTVRLRADEFDPAALLANVRDGADRTEALRDLLAEILQRSSAVPLPDPDSALGLIYLEFDDLKSYEREVLRVG